MFLKPSSAGTALKNSKQIIRSQNKILLQTSSTSTSTELSSTGSRFQFSTHTKNSSCRLHNLSFRNISRCRRTLLQSPLSPMCQDQQGLAQTQAKTMTTKASDTIMNVFDRKTKRLQKERAAIGLDGEDVTIYDYIKDEFGYRTSDRICDIKRKMPVAVDLGCGRGHVSKNVYADMVECLVQCDLSASAVKSAEVSPEVPTHKLIVDEEFLPFKDNSVDLVVSSLSLHWVNDLPGCLRQILRALKRDGVLLGTMFGGDTLYELRVALQLAETEREGGFAPHISPFTTSQDLGNLLTRAGFTMLTIDVDTVVINYPSMFEVMFDLKGMGENNCSWSRKPLLHRDTMMAAAAIYKEMYGKDQDGVPATFEVINFIGWKPDPSQPKAAERGSGEVSLKDLGKFEKISKDLKQKSQVDSGTPGSTADMQELEKELKDLSSKYRTPDDEDGGTGATKR